MPVQFWGLPFAAMLLSPTRLLKGRVMHSRAAMLALMASLTLVGVVRAQDRDVLTTGSIAPAKSLSGIGMKGEPSIRAGFGFSPFMEEGLVTAVPPARHDGLSTPVPAYLRDLGGFADPP